MVTAIATANTTGIGTAAIATKRLLSGRTVTTTETATVVRSLSTATDQQLRNPGGFPSGRPLVFCRLKKPGRWYRLCGQLDGFELLAKFRAPANGAMRLSRRHCSKIGGNQIVRTSASAHIEPGRSSTYQITVAIECIQKARLIGPGIRLNSPQGVFVDEK